MAQRDRRVSVDPDGVRIERTAGVRAGVWVAVGLLFLLGAALLLTRRSAAPPAAEVVRAPDAALPNLPEDRPGRRVQDRVPARVVSAEGARPVPRRRQVDAPAADPGEPPPADAGADTAAGPSGIALFPPPGTDPPKPGIIVPEDFELPPGYVRHYQATDDGRRLPAILMFHPDYDWVDERGEPLEIPEDRVVPPELAPPGLPISILEVPETNIPQIEEPPGS